MRRGIDRHDWFAEYGDLLATELKPEPRFTAFQQTAERYAFYRLAYNTEDNDCSVRALAVVNMSAFGSLASASSLHLARPDKKGTRRERPDRREDR